MCWTGVHECNRLVTTSSAKIRSILVPFAVDGRGELSDEGAVHIQFGQSFGLCGSRRNLCLSESEVFSPVPVGALRRLLSRRFPGCHLIAAGARPRPLVLYPAGCRRFTGFGVLSVNAWFLQLDETRRLPDGLK